MSLSGKRIVVTGGAGFIGTTLARRLVAENEIVAFDNLHRDSLAGTALAEHENFSIVHGDVLDGDALAEVVRGATHLVHAAAIAGVDTVIESPVRTMRVNMIGTYNALEAALGTRETIERVIEFSTSEVFGTYAFKVDEEHVTTQGSVGEARWTYAVSKLAGEHMAHAYYDELGLPTVVGAAVQRLRTGADRRRRDPRVHRGRARRARPHDPRRRVADPRLVLRRRHGRGAPARARAPERGRRELQHRQRALGRHDLRPRPADQADHRLRRGRSSSSRSTTTTSSSGSRTWARRASCSGSRRRSSSTRASSARSTGTASSRPRRQRERADPARPAGRRRGGARGARRGRRDGDADDGAEGRRVRAALARRLRHRRGGRRLVRHGRAAPRAAGPRDRRRATR